MPKQKHVTSHYLLIHHIKAFS